MWQAVVAVLALGFGLFNLFDAFSGRNRVAFPVNIFGGCAGIQAGLYWGLPLVL